MGQLEFFQEEDETTLKVLRQWDGLLGSSGFGSSLEKKNPRLPTLPRIAEFLSGVLRNVIQMLVKEIILAWGLEEQRTLTQSDANWLNHHQHKYS